ncbi:MAG TPA: DUF2232 domain-containing protein, partial [Firmicutes bacterium]|nr:DUF2232 domain-containing protein [Bacillota bacterium]
MTQSSLRPLAEGALMAALAVMLGLAGFYLPVLGMVATIVGPVPIVVAYLRQGPRTAVLAAAVAALLLGIFLGAIQALIMGFAFGSLGLALGRGFSRQAPASTTVLWAGLAVACATTVSAGLGFLFLHINPLDTVEQLLAAYERAPEIWARLGVGGQMLEQMKAMTGAMRQFFWLAWPAAMAGGVLGAAAINWAVARSILRRLGYQVTSAAPFVQWRLPRWVLIPLAVGMALMVARPHYGPEWLYRLGFNLYLVFSWA